MPFFAGSLLADLFGGAGGATAAAGTIGLMGRAYESAAVRNILVNLSKASKGSPKEAQLMTSLAQAIRNVTGEENGE